MDDPRFGNPPLRSEIVSKVVKGTLQGAGQDPTSVAHRSAPRLLGQWQVQVQQHPQQLSSSSCLDGDVR